VNPSNGQAAITSIYSTGNIQASYFLGNGSQLTGIASAYGNANVAAYLPTYGGNILANVVQANVLATAIRPVNAAIDIGTSTSSFRDIYVGNVITPAGNQGNATQIQPASGVGQSGVAFIDAITGQAAHISAGDAVFTMFPAHTSWAMEANSQDCPSSIQMPMWLLTCPLTQVTYRVAIY